jgi:uncharacterized protein YaaQ
MKLLVIIVQDADAGRLRDAFTQHQVPFTKLASTGGFLRRGVCTFVSGVADEHIEKVKQLVKQNSQKRTATAEAQPSVDTAGGANTYLDQLTARVEVGGATVFELKVEAFVKL